jgi:hypothetical protein
MRVKVESFPWYLEETVIQALRYHVDLIKVMVYAFDEVLEFLSKKTFFKLVIGFP